MRLGVFGGSFNPVHYGHLLLAETCREQGRLDEVWFVPAAIPPHKQGQVLTEARARIEMLELAMAGNASFRVSTIEIDRGGVSYTVDTLEEIRRRCPAATLFLLMGADSVGDLPTWKAPQRVCELAIPMAVSRAGSPLPDFDRLLGLIGPARLDEIRQHRVEMPLIELSSSDLRQRIREGKSIRYRTPRSVERYIETHQLFRSAK